MPQGELGPGTAGPVPVSVLTYNLEPLKGLPVFPVFATWRAVMHLDTGPHSSLVFTLQGFVPFMLENLFAC